jgi:hypothetical protein
MDNTLCIKGILKPYKVANTNLSLSKLGFIRKFQNSGRNGFIKSTQGLQEAGGAEAG